MKRFIALILGLMVTAGSALAQTATPTNTPQYTPFVVGVEGFDLANSTATQRFRTGIPYFGKEGIFQYGSATETIASGNWVKLNESNQASLITTTIAGVKPYKVCVATSAMSTTTPYGWFWCGGGVFNAMVASGVAATDPLTTTATAGVAGLGGAAISGCMNVDAGAGASTPVRVMCATFAAVNIPSLTPTATPTP